MLWQAKKPKETNTTNKYFILNPFIDYLNGIIQNPKINSA
ncbi:MAG: hypothetical protein IGBAC_0014 [Ignavibacteriae bacterium]|nr:MAG: hypothetical protein IGBAC_0014 [Ignavibacteriota bacterium]